MNRIKLIIIIFLLTASKVFCQFQLDSLDYIQTSQIMNLLFTRLDKQLNTYNLNSNLQFNNQNGNFHYWLSENYNSTYIRSFDKSSRDEHFFSFSGNYTLAPEVNIGAAVNNSILSDSRKIEINQASVSDATLYSQVFPVESVTIAPFFGYENNRQIGESDNGYLYGGEGDVEDIRISNFSVQSQLKFRNEDISPRKNALRYINLLIKNSTTDEFTNQINYQYFLNRKDFYFTADSITSNQYNIINNIQSRIETNNVLQDKLSYAKFLNVFSLDLTGRLTWRSIDRDTRYRPTNISTTSLFDTRIDEMRLEFESVTNYKSDIFNGSFHITYSERDEKHIAKDYPGSNKYFYDERSQQESQKNNTSKRISASVTGNLNISDSDVISFSMYQNKLGYDTPSPLNYDDRDELLSIARIQYVKTLSPFFSAFVNAEGTFNHIVYIYSEKSSNNNINRIIKFSAGGSYHGKYVSSYNGFDVSANYTVYDFEDLLPNYRSYSFRQFSANDSSKIKFDKNFTLVHYGYIRLSEQGDLRWASFSTHPTRYLAEMFSVPKIVAVYNKLSFAFGIRYYSLTTYNYDGDKKIPDSKYNSIGPLTEISLIMEKSLSLSILGWYEFITTDGNVSRQQANLTMQASWNF